MRSFRTMKLLALGLVAVMAALLALVVPAGAAKKQSAEPVTLRLGYFPNVTHASAIVGVEEGIFQKSLGKNVTLDLHTFNSGTEALAAFQAEALDASYIGPSPTITAWTKLNKGVKIVSGSASGGAYLVVNPSINSAADLKGKSVASPQLGNTQDVALRTWLKSKGLNTDTTGGGDVSIRPQDNATTLNAFKAGDLAGAWVPEPWATRLVTEGGGKILVDEADLWPAGQYVTTQLVVTTSFLKDHPEVVQQLVTGQVAANDFIKSKPFDAQTDVSNNIAKVTGKAIPGDLVIASFKNIEFTDDPIASSLVKNNKDASKIEGLTSADSLKGIYDLTFLSQALTAAKEPTVKIPKL
ncbi:MAG TPA: ABC transporter substrate-binding protein [Acidimicrobiia bacterium]|jgi:NitT/TauT family transport system substrate-binding protein